MIEISERIKEWVEWWINNNPEQVKKIKSYADVLELAKIISTHYLQTNLAENIISGECKIEYILCEKYKIRNIFNDIFDFIQKNSEKSKEELCELFLKDLDKRYSKSFWKGNKEKLKEIIDKRIQWVLWYINWK